MVAVIVMMIYQVIRDLPQPPLYTDTYYCTCIRITFLTCSTTILQAKATILKCFIIYIYNIMLAFILYVYDSVLTMKIHVVIVYTK